MLKLSANFLNQPILSLRTGGQIALVVRPILNPHNLKVEGFYCKDRFENKELILLIQDIREVDHNGFFVNDHDVLVEPEDLVRLKDVLSINFEVLGKHMVSVSKQKLGRVNDYAIDDESMFVHKLYVSQSLLKSFSGGQLGIDRTQIVEITNQKIVVQDPLDQGKIRSKVPAGVPVTS